jgi:hypothetical protein
LRLLEALLLLQLRLLLLRLLLLWLLARESGGLGLKLRATEWRGLSGEASRLGRKSCWLWLLHWGLLLARGELRVGGLLLLLLHEWCLTWSSSTTTAEVGIRRGEHYDERGTRIDKTDAQEPTEKRLMERERRKRMLRGSKLNLRSNLNDAVVGDAEAR